MRKIDRDRIAKLERCNKIMERRLWLLEHPAKYAFNSVLEFRVIEKYETTAAPSYGMFSMPNTHIEPIYKTVTGICKGVNDVVELFETYIRYYNVEHLDQLILINEKDIIRSLENAKL